jgi:hypothetical protein
MWVILIFFFRGPHSTCVFDHLNFLPFSVDHIKSTSVFNHLDFLSFINEIVEVSTLEGTHVIAPFYFSRRSLHLIEFRLICELIILGKLVENSKNFVQLIINIISQS